MESGGSRQGADDPKQTTSVHILVAIAEFGELLFRYAAGGGDRLGLEIEQFKRLVEGCARVHFQSCKGIEQY